MADDDTADAAAGMPGPGPEVGRAEARRAAFLSAARDVFLERGFEAASMAEILARAGGSMSTLYSQFADKEGLFQAVVDQQVAWLTQQSELELGEHSPIVEGLERIGVELMLRLTAPRATDMFRLMVAQAKNFPDMVNRFSVQVPERTRQALGRYLEDRARAGEIAINEPETAAGLFIDMIRARLQFRCLLDPCYRPSEEEIRNTVRRAVRVFVGGAAAL